jgi:periplasmic protein CpxP/Spy
MDIFSKQKLVGWLIIVLIVTNVLTLSIIWFKELNRKQPASPPPPPREQVNKYLDEQLNLSPEQKELFNKYREQHADTTRMFNDKIAFLKREILLETFKDNPDKNKIHDLIGKMGGVQKDYEEFLFRHFKNLESVCDPQQKEILKRIFLSSFNAQIRPPRRNEGGPPPPRQGGPPPRQ